MSMRRLASAAARSLAILCAALFIIVTPAVLLVFNAEQHLLSAATYKQAIVHFNLYERFPALAAEQLTWALGSPADLQGPAQSGIESAIREVLPASWLQQQTETALDQAFRLLDPGRPDASAKISLVELKDRLDSQTAVEAVDKMIRALPPCSAEQQSVLVLDSAAASGDLAGLPLCRPSDQALANLTPKIQDLLSRQTAQIPPEIELGTHQAGEPVANVRAVFLRYRTIVRWSLAGPALLLGLIALLVPRSVRSLLLWWGVPLTLAGLIGLGFGLAAWISLHSLAAAQALNLSPYLSPGAMQTGFDMARYLVHQVVLAWAGREAWLIWLVGYAMLVAAYSLRPGRRADRATGVEGGHAESLNLPAQPASR
jgi:DNA polymerase III psi subunit